MYCKSGIGPVDRSRSNDIDRCIDSDGSVCREAVVTVSGVYLAGSAVGEIVVNLEVPDVRSSDVTVGPPADPAARSDDDSARTGTTDATERGLVEDVSGERHSVATADTRDNPNLADGVVTAGNDDDAP